MNRTRAAALALLLAVCAATLSGQSTLAKTVAAQNDQVAFTNIGSVKTVGVQITGSGSWTIAFEGSTDGTTYFSVPGTVFGSTSTATSATAAGAWAVNVAGLYSFRARCSVYSSGNPVITIKGSRG
jgi:outer membrane lipoprotein SlyB